MSSDGKKKNKLPGSLALVLIVLAFVLDIAGDSNSVSISISAIGGAALIIAVLIAVKRLRGEKKKDKTERASAPAASPSAAPQRETALHFDLSKERSEGKYALYDHDTAHRLEQLDSFLKNGIIDKKEYRLLKERYLSGGKEAN